MESIPHVGMEWIQGRTRILVTKSNDGCIDLYLYPNFPSEDRYIHLDFARRGYQFYIYNIHGNGYESGLQEKGYGTLLVNLAIQLMKLWALEDVEVTYTVFGKCVAMDAPPKGTEEFNQNVANRIRFWKRFGLHIKGNSDYEYMQAKLNDLKCVGSRTCDSGAPLDLQLDQFWRVSERPEILESDMNNFVSCSQSIAAEELISLHHEASELRKKSDSSRNRLTQVLNTALNLGIFASTSYFVINGTVDVFQGAVFGVTAWFGSLFFRYDVVMFLASLFPSARKLVAVESELTLVFDDLSKKILSSEDSHNGLLWRVLPALAKESSELEQQEFMDLADRSRRGFCMRLSRSELLSYLRFITASRAVLKKMEIPKPKPWIHHHQLVSELK